MNYKNILRNIEIEISPTAIVMEASYSLSIVNVNGKKGLYDRNGQQFLTECVYDDIMEYNVGTMFLLEKNGRYGLCDLMTQDGTAQCKLLTECQYDSITLRTTENGLKFLLLKEEDGMQCYFPQTQIITDYFSGCAVVDDYYIAGCEGFEGKAIRLPSGEVVFEY